MIKDKILFILGLSAFVLSIISLILRTHNELLFHILHVIGNISFVVAGFFFFYGSITYSKHFLKIGLNFGICAWTLLIISTLYGIFWNYVRLVVWELTYYLFLFLIAIPQKKGWGGSLPGLEYNRGFYGSIIHIILAIIGVILGIIINRRMVSKFKS